MPNWKKILGVAGAGVGGLLTGGATWSAIPGIVGGTTGAAIGTAAGAAAPVIGKWAGGRAKGREAEAGQRMSQDELRQRLWAAQTNAMLDRSRLLHDQAQFQMTAPTIRAQQAARGDLLANVQDVTIPDNPRVQVMHFAGGLRPSALGPNARAAGAALSGIGLANLGKDTFAVPDLPVPPGLFTLPRGNFLDKILGVAGPATALVGALNRPQPPAITGTPTLGMDEPYPYDPYGIDRRVPAPPPYTNPSPYIK